MSETTIFTREQVLTLTHAVKVICARRGIDPLSGEGRDIAARLIDECRGNETEDEMVAKFLH